MRGVGGVFALGGASNDSAVSSVLGEGRARTDAAGHTLTWSGRLDNRAALVDRIGLNGCRDRFDDATVVLAALRRFGTDVIRDLIGDFALAYYDATVRRLVLARDPIGARTLYYHVAPTRVAWATRLGTLVQTGRVPLEIDDQYIADYFNVLIPPDATPFRQVRAVPPAHVVEFTSDGRESCRQYWSLDPREDIRCASDAEYEERFKALFFESVRARLRSGGTVLAELSGGLDSSSIVCAAHHIGAGRETGLANIETVSFVTDSSPTSDERAWMAHVERRTGFRSHHVLETAQPYISPLVDSSDIWTPNNALLTSAYPMALQRFAAESGAGLLLCGEGGDEILHSTTHPEPLLGDLAARGRVIALHKALVFWSDLLKRPYADLLRDSLRQLRLSSRRFSIAPADWLTSSVQRRVQTGHDDWMTRQIAAFRWPTQRYQAAGFWSAVLKIANGTRAEAYGFDITYPFLHRPLVAFLQAIPFDQKLRPLQTRSIMRRALRDVLPAETLARRGKGNPSELSLRAVQRSRAVVQDLVTDARVCARGYVDRDRWLAAIDRAAAGAELRTVSLFRTFILELWLRSLEGRSTTTDRLPSHARRQAATSFPGSPQHLLWNPSGDAGPSVAVGSEPQ